MKTVPFAKIDAFTTDGRGGNPAAAVFLKNREELSTGEMQRIAREMAGYVSEVAFLAPHNGREADFSMRYYSSEKEVALCGHATIATMHSLAADREIPEGHFRIETSGGFLAMENRYTESGTVLLQAPQPVFFNNEINREQLRQAMGMEATGLDYSFSPAIVDAGLKTLIVPVDSLHTCLTLEPDFDRLLEYSKAIGIEVITAFCRDTTANTLCRSRVFCPTFGYLEDPATGSGNAALGSYLLRDGFWDGQQQYIEQGPDTEHPNRILIKASPRGQVCFGGEAVVRLTGEYRLHPEKRNT